MLDEVSYWARYPSGVVRTPCSAQATTHVAQTFDTAVSLQTAWSSSKSAVNLNESVYSFSCDAHVMLM